MDVTRQLKQLGTDTVLYGLGSVLQSFIGFLLFPIYTRLLTKEDFGAQDLVLTGITIITYLLTIPYACLIDGMRRPGGVCRAVAFNRIVSKASPRG